MLAGESTATVEESNKQADQENERVVERKVNIGECEGQCETGVIVGCDVLRCSVCNRVRALQAFEVKVKRKSSNLE